MRNWFLILLCLSSIMAAVVVFQPTGMHRKWLEDAVASANLPLVRFCLAAGVEPQRIFVHVIPYRFDAGDFERRKKVMCLLIDYGASPSQRDPHTMMSPVHIAVQRGLAKYVEYLVGIGADINSPCKMGLTPVMLAVRKRDEAMVKRLVELGASLETRNNLGQTALRFAVSKAQSMIVCLLMNGADPAALDNNGATPLVAALKEGRQAAYKTLLDQAGIKACLAKKRFHGWGLLHFAAEAKENLALDLLKRGDILKTVNVNIQTEKLLTPLHIAAAQGHSDFLRALLKAHADPNMKDVHQRSPLWYAICREKVESARVLLRNKADVNQEDENGQTILHIAAKANSDIDASIIATLIRYGANINAADTNGRTPLHLAAVSGSVSGLRELIYFGADKAIKDKDGYTALDHASSPEKKAVLIKTRAVERAKLMKEFMGPPVYVAVRIDNGSVIKHLVYEQKADVNETNLAGSTALHYASKLGVNAAYTLLSLKADTKKKDADGKTAEELAVAAGHSQIAEAIRR